MKMTVEDLGKWIAIAPQLHSARVNSDLETIAGEARSVFLDPSITEEDVTNAVKVYHTAKQAAAHAKASGGAAVATAQAEAK